MSESLKARIQRALPYFSDADFSSHATDLYVVSYAELIMWLRNNYELFGNITTFIGARGANWNGAGRPCIEIPFEHVP